MKNIMMNKIASIVLLCVVCVISTSAQADTIDPTSYTDTLLLGESVTIRKTVTVTNEPPTDAVLDVMFVFDLTGSMGGAIEAAKSAAADIMTGLTAFGDLQTGTGWYSDPGSDGTYVDLNTGNTALSSGISDMWDGSSCSVGGTSVGCGGDFPEMTYAAIKDSAENTSWRPGSNRFIVVLGDASNKPPVLGPETLAALTAGGVDLIGLEFGAGAFGSSITDIGGTVFAGSTDPSSIVTSILAGVSDSFSDYSSVTVDDFGAGLPGVGVSVACVTADIGICSGDSATGTFDRSIDRSFEFDVTFTGSALGVHIFDTKGVVDGGIIASERDMITVVDVPEPVTFALFLIGLCGLCMTSKRS